MKWMVPLLAMAIGSCTTVADVVRAGDPMATVDYFIALGRTLNLRDTGQVRIAIGKVQGVPTRGSSPPSFAAYTFPAGEIVYNPDSGYRQRYLGIRLKSCVPTAAIRARLRGPEFLPSSFRATVAVYEHVPYRDNPRTAFSFFDTGPGCVQAFGISQWDYEI